MTGMNIPFVCFADLLRGSFRLDFEYFVFNSALAGSQRFANYKRAAYSSPHRAL